MSACFAAVHHGRDSAPRTASGPGRVLRTQDGTVHGARCGTWSARLPVILRGTLRRDGPVKSVSLIGSVFRAVTVSLVLSNVLYCSRYWVTGLLGHTQKAATLKFLPVAI